MKKITEMFSNAAAQAEPTTHTASASLSADALNELEARKMAIVADITRLAAELAVIGPDLGAPVGVGTLTGAPALARANLAAEWFGRGEPWTGERASTRADLSATLRDADRDYGRPSSALSPTWAAPERAVLRADRAVKLHEAGLAAEARAEHAQNLAAVLRAGDAAALCAAEADALAAMKRKGAK